MENLLCKLLNTSINRRNLKLRVSFYETIGVILNVAPGYFNFLNSAILEMIEELIIACDKLTSHCEKVSLSLLTGLPQKKTG